MLSKKVTVLVGAPQTIVFSGDATAANPELIFQGHL